MNSKVKNFLRGLFSIVGIRIIRKEKDRELRLYISNLEKELRSIKPYYEKFLIVDRLGADLWDDFRFTKSQFSQEILVLAILDWKRTGYFVEFGALDGVTHSNTWLLENKYGWNGLLAEPAREWHETLKKNRKCRIDERAVWSSSGRQLNFRVTSAKGLSTLDQYWNADKHAQSREAVETYPVPTVSLKDLFEFHNVPNKIDFLSIDTEGSELDIIREFPFNKYDISIITIEHNFSANREEIYQLMVANGFLKVFEDLSQVDDWYVKRSLLEGRVFRNEEGPY